MDVQAERRRLFTLLVPIGIFTAASLIGMALLPALLARNPLLLMILTSRNRILLLTAGTVDVLPFVVIAVLRRFLEDPFYFALGRRYGDRAIVWADRRLGTRGLIARWSGPALRRAAYPLVFVSPGGLVCAVAGATGMRARTFVLVDIAGGIAVVTLMRVFGVAIADPVRLVIDFFERNLLWTTAVSCLLVGGWLLVHRYWTGSGRRPPEAVLDPKGALDPQAVLDPEGALDPQAVAPPQAEDS